jgi:hypothetical protein
MYLLRVTNKAIYDIIQSLTIPDKSRELLKTIIVRYDYSYTKFLYALFSVYMNAYVRMSSGDTNLSAEEQLNVLNTFKSKLQNVDYDSIFIADKLDVLFGASPQPPIDHMKCTTFLYEDIYNRIENIVGVGLASDCMEDIFESIEAITTHIESTFLHLLSRTEADNLMAILHMHIAIIEEDMYISVY